MNYNGLLNFVEYALRLLHPYLWVGAVWIFVCVCAFLPLFYFDKISMRLEIIEIISQKILKVFLYLYALK